ncbi:NHL domain-containing protein [Microbulbifer donghaiensis]|uniref:NHL domain-containing protein n=1 Tax=Microbulbifer donghaiensis TaxID=494016 RepID=UPI0013564F11|nr:RHS repeat-associated core domain-containing protein [Microbulbifer donghaiensis]
MSSLAVAGEFSVSGVQDFIRETGQPVEQTVTFSAPAVGDHYRLRILNGEGASFQVAYPVTSGVISLNGTQKFSPEDFTQSASYLEVPVSLELQNTLTVKLAGQPGSGLRAEVIGFDDDIPGINAVVSPAANAAGWHRDDVTVSFICSDSGSGIEDCSGPVVVSSEGENQIFTGAVTDKAGNSAEAQVTINLDKTAPTIAIIQPAGGAQVQDLRPEILLGFHDNLVADTSSIELTINGSAGICTADSGAALCQPQNDLPPGEIRLTASIRDLAGNATSADSSFTITDGGGGEPGDLPPEPAEVATPIDTTGTSSLKSTTEFLYTGTNPIQAGVDPEVIEERRASVIRGTVRDKENNPLHGVTITIKGHPEFGRTQSRENGGFDMAVNGGGYLVIDYEKEGYLPAQRRVKAPWNDYALAEDVVLIPLDSQVTTIDLTDDSQPFQIHRGGLQTDDDGSRQATILFPAGTTATMTLPGGGVASIDQLSVRATEYTVGENGPETMPGELPPTSGYTYAVELSVDEGIAAGATRVDFSQPLPVYVDNFLEFPAGTVVPAGWYDQQSAAWIPSDDGVVIEIIDVIDGLATLDVDGSGNAADAFALARLGITDAELQQLTHIYEVGASLWRVPVDHFTPWDFNWPLTPPDDAERPEPETETDEPEPEPECEGGSIIECQGQVLRERVQVVGTPLTLNYRSDRVPGRKAFAEIQLTGDTIPSSLKEVVLEVSIAGRKFEYSFAPQMNLQHQFVWDGVDVFGRKLSGSQMANIKIGYVYDAFYSVPDNTLRAFSRSGLGSLVDDSGSGIPARQTITLWSSTQKQIVASATGGEEFGFWTLSNHHKYDIRNGQLDRGDGQSLKKSAIAEILTIAGTGEYGDSGDGGDAREAQFRGPLGAAVAPDGTVYIADRWNNRIRRIDTSGIISTMVEGDDSASPCWPTAEINIISPADVAVDGDGNVYIANSSACTIDVIRPDGSLERVAGTGQLGFSGDGGPAVNAKLNYPSAVEVGPDGSLYIVTRSSMGGSGARIRRIGPDGIISTIAGTGEFGSEGDGGLAINASFEYSGGLAVSQDGSIYIADFGADRVRRIDPNGVISTVAGTGSSGFSGDGGKAIDATLGPADVAVGRDGSLYIADTGNRRIRRVTPDGIISTVVGTGERGVSGDGGAANNAELNWPLRIALGNADELYIIDNNAHNIRKVEFWPPLLQENTFVASAGGRELYEFDVNGRHLNTYDTVSGEVVYHFHYDENNLLRRIEDAYGSATVIERDSSGTNVTIVAPDGQRTTLLLNPEGYLASATNPAGESHTMGYTGDGLLTRFTDPNQHSSTMTYDALGFLQTDINAAEGGWTLERDKLQPGNEYRMTSAEGHTTRYQVVPQSVGGRLRNTIYPDGTILTKLFGLNGDVLAIAPDGTETFRKPGPDPRFGLAAPVSDNVTVTTPSGLKQVIVTTRSAALEDKSDPLSHTSLGQSVSVNGRVTTATYDGPTRTWLGITPEGRQSTTELDEKGRPIFQQAGGLAPLGFGYDTRGRLVVSTAGTGMEQRSVSYGYDSDGFLESITDTLQRTTSFDYDLAGRVTRQTYHDSRSVGYQYDPAGNLTAIIPPGREAHLFNYTKVNLEEGYTPPDLDGVETVTRYQYNKDKQLTLVERPDSRTIAYDYDDGGRLASRTIDRGSYSYVYDENSGQLSTITAPGGGTLSYSYDGFLSLSETWGGSIAGSVSWNYDNNFWLTQQCVNTNNCVSFGYDDDGLLLQAGALSQTRHAQSGLLTSSELGSTVTEYGYNSFGELLSAETEASGTALASFGYQRDSLGRISSKTEILNGSAVTESYEYDTAGRLKSVTRDGVTTSWQYDSNGNRTHENGQQVATYDEQDRLLTYKGASYDYTANGELKSKTEIGANTSYSYDEFGNLISATLPGDMRIEYVIDGRDRRIGKKVNGQLVQGFHYEDQLSPVVELDGSGNIVARFVYAEKVNVPAYMIKGGTTYRIISDHLGSPRLVVKASTGEIAQRMDYDAWGNVIADTNPGFQPFGFAGGIYDQHTKLTRFGARDYDAETGRWTAKDPIRFDAGDSNIYAYVSNDPINSIDPTGLLCFDFGKFADQIEKNRLDLIATLGTLVTAEAIGTMPKTPGELRGLGVPKGQLNPYTGQLSRWSGRLGTRVLREAGRAALGVAAGTVATGALIFEGFYDWGVIGKAAWDNTSSGDCECEGN